MIDFDDLETSESSLREVDIEFRALRCARERAREPIFRAAQRGDSTPAAGGAAVGVFHGVRLPRSSGELLEWGAGWLSEAFHTAGTIPPDVDVASIDGIQTLAVGTAARWLLLKVEFRPANDVLHKCLLVKLPLQDAEGGAEVLNGALSKSPALHHGEEAAFVEVNAYRLLEGACPFSMPRYYFGDISDCGGAFVLVTEWIGNAEDSYMVRAFPAWSLESEKCVLENYHGRYLAGRNDLKGSLFLTTNEMDKAYWSLTPVEGENRRYFLQAWNEQYLAVSGADEQDFHTSPAKGEQEKWSLVPVMCQPNTFYLQCSYGTHLACLDDKQNTLYMSPNRRDWEKWKRVPLDAKTQDCERHGHLDLREASLELCDALVRRGAALAGLHKSGQLGPVDAVDRAFGAAVVKNSLPKPEAAGDSSGLGQDQAFVDQAMAVQDFVRNVGSHLFPERVTTAASMKAFRAVLVTAKQNPEIIEWWCNFRKDYVALGPDLPALDGAFVSWDGGDPSPGLSNWAHLSVSSLGCKVWEWLSSADHRVLEQSLDPLLWQFTMTYQQSGGPYLDAELLRAHFFMAVIASTVGLLEVLPEMYRLCPREEWASVACIGDRRLRRRMPGGRWLWQHVQRFINVAVMIETYDLRPWLEKTATVMFSEHGLGGLSCDSFTGCLVKASLADVFAEPSQQSALLGRLLCGLLAVAVTIESSGSDWVRVISPVPGWIRAGDLEPVSGTVPRSVAQDADTHWMALMYHTRRQFTGYSPRHRCFTSTRMLIDELYLRERHERLLSRLGHGKPRSRMGSFLAEERQRVWWPPGYESWAHHTFLIFEDGTVADITADQWDSAVPQVWWPADSRRYRAVTREADAARATRRSHGIARWRELDLQDDCAGVTRTRQRWLEIEKSHGETNGRP